MMEKDHYDQAATVFSPDGRVYQVEYAREAIKRGGLALGMVFDGGVLFTIDKSIFSPLIEEEYLEKFFAITPEVGAAASGLIADARVLVDILREKAQEEAQVYGEKPDLKNLVMWISKIYEVYTRYEGVRPFGTSLIIGGKGPEGYHLYETDPSGVFQERKATAIGKGSQKALELLEAGYRPGMSRDEAIQMALKILKDTLEERPQDDQKGEEIHILSDGGFERIDLDDPVDMEKYINHLTGTRDGGRKQGKSKKPSTSPEPPSDISIFIDTIPRLSSEARESLLERYRDLEELKRAYFDELLALKGIGKATAERIVRAIKALK
ncbi:MAG: archaeal proteasome endopeptidase complex subunit alpha [Candidatus Thermoplasmatota archaeon]|nr:archaeal proteasome endopeptidase complex subunit alpha [Candidatus Thermoplasmatota archaeon]